MSKAELDRIRTVYLKRQAAVNVGRYHTTAPAEAHALVRRREAFENLLRHWLPGGLQGQSVLDVGCGNGSRLAEWEDWGGDPKQLIGVDLMPSLIDMARQRFSASGWLVASGDNLPFCNGCFDVVTQSMAVSSILDPNMRAGFADEMWRVLRPGGALLWYDFHYPNPWNSNVLPVRRRELNSLFPVPPRELSTLTLIPPLARRIARRAPSLVRFLERMPILHSHHVALFIKDL